MDRALQDYYEARFALCATQGWKEFVEDMVKLEQSINNLDGCSTTEALHFRKGQLDVLRLVLQLEAISKQTYDDLKRGDDAASE
jgi:hypothetical protein